MARSRSMVEDPARLGALYATGLLDSPADEAFERMTRIAVDVLPVPAAFVSLVDRNRDFYMSACGFGEPLASSRELRGVTFCHYAIDRAEPLVIPDTSADPVYAAVPTVKSLGVAAYVGIPIVTSDGHALGSFCAVDFQPRSWTRTEVEVLRELAASARREIELRHQLRVVEAQEAQLRSLADDLSRQVVEARVLAAELEKANRKLASATGSR